MMMVGVISGRLYQTTRLVMGRIRLTIALHVISTSNLVGGNGSSRYSAWMSAVTGPVVTTRNLMFR